MPAANADVATVATPLPFSVTGEPMFAPSSLNCTVPVGVPLPPVTVAVKVTCWPALEGLGDDPTAVELADLARVTVTVYVLVVVPSCAVTTVVIGLAPMFRLIALLAVPEATVWLFTFTVAPDSATVGVTVVLVVEFGTLSV